jgi:hypothetical protein
MTFRKGLFFGLAALGMAASISAHAAPGDFCKGFEAGWKSAYENRNMFVAATPFCPFPPFNGDTFSVGYEVGLRAALAKIGK